MNEQFPIPEEELPGYTIYNRIATGGMADIYLAKDRALDRSVAIKVIKKLTPELKQRFEQEKEILTTLQHPHIVKLIAAMPYGDFFCIVMEYFPSGTLANLIKDNPNGLSAAKASQLIHQIASALSYAHQKDIIHRDIKDKNILLYDDGSPAVADFGIAKVLSNDVQITRQGEVFGSPGYMSPEQFLGKPLDKRTDIYSLGVLFYELLSGRKPFLAKDFDALSAQHINDPIPTLNTPHAPYQPLIERMMAKAPEDRYPSIGEFTAALDTCEQKVAEEKWRDHYDKTVSRPNKLAVPPELPPKSLLWQVTAGVLALVAIGFGFWQSNTSAEKMVLENEITQLEAKEQAQSSKIVELNRENTDLTEKQNELAENLRSTDELYEQLKVKLNDTGKSLQKTHEKLQAATVGKTKLTEQVAAFTEQVVALVEEKSNLQAQLTSSQQNFDALQKDYDQVKSELDARRESDSFKTGFTINDSLKIGDEGPAMVFIKGGLFKIGSPEGEADRGSDEDQRDVDVDDFYIGKYEVTFAEYDVFAEATSRGKPDDNWGRGDHPVINVSWYDAMAYANWLSKQTEKKYSLPTEAQWEYAARAGETEPFFTGNCITTAQANYNGNHDCDNRGAKTGEYRGKTVPVDTLLANLWGLHHMAGNVWEWTCSEYSDQYGEHESVCIDDPNSDAKLVVRGGSWKDSLFWARSAKRARNTPNSQHSAQGFRLVRSK